MPQSHLEIRASGLYLDPSPHSDAPPGALREALNVVVRRAGVVERRPGFEDMGVSYAAERIVGLIPYNGGLMQVTETQVRNASGTAITSSPDPGPGFQGASWAVTKKNLYLPSAGTLLKRVESKTGSAASNHGVPRGRSGIVDEATSPDNAWLANGETVAYRVVYKVEVNGIPVLGAPSGRMVFENQSGSAAAPTLNLTLPAEAAAGWVVQAYRSETAAAGITPSDELALAVEYELQAADISAGEIDVDDDIDESDRRAFLYTNATQKTLLKEGNRAPGAKVVAEYEGMLFLGNVTEVPSLAVRITDVPGGRWTIDNPDTTSDILTGTPNLTDAGWADKPARFNGQYIFGSDDSSHTDFAAASTQIPAFTWITSAGTATDWTLSNNALANGTNMSVHLIDVFEVDDQDTTYLYGFHDQSTGGLGNQDLTAGVISVSGLSGDAGMNEALGRLADSINTRQSNVVAVHAGDGVLILEAEPNGTINHLRLPRRFEAYVEVLTPGATLTNDGDFVTIVPPTDTAHPSRLYYSELDIPEHVPYLNCVDIGQADEPILAMAATRRSLYIFKTDGVWLMRGETPESLTLEDLDTTARLIHPAMVTVMGDVCFAFTDEGLVAVTEGGVSESLSAPALEKVLRLVREKAQAEEWKTTATSGEGWFLEAIDGEQWLLMGIPAAYTDDGAEYVYCFDLRTSAWSRWSFDDIEPACAARLGSRFYIGGGTAAGAGTYARARQDDDESPHADDDFDVSISSAGPAVSVTLPDGSTGTTHALTLTGTGSTDGQIGQWCVGDNGSKGIVRSVAGAVITVLTTTGDWSTDTTVTIYKCVAWEVEWTARTAQHPLEEKQFSTGAMSFENIKRLDTSTGTFESDRGNTGTVTFSHTFNTADYGPDAVRFVTHRAAAYSAQMFYSWSGDDGASVWALTSLRLDFNTAGERVGRRYS